MSHDAMATHFKYRLLILLRSSLRLIAILVLAGLLGATLIWYAPGLESTGHGLDPRLSSESVRRLEQIRDNERTVFAFYWRYLLGAARGDLGVSRTFDRPNLELIRERLPVSLLSIGQGLAIGWSLGLLLAAAGVLIRTPSYHVASAAISGIFLCLPAAFIALVCLRSGAPVSLGIAAVIFPRIFRYAHELLQSGVRQDHVITARAKGLRPLRVLAWHIIPPALPQLAALAGVSISIGLGAAIPVEVLCDSPGIGQLAWKAALGRDLSLLVGLTLIITAVTVAANSLADAAVSATVEGRA